MICIPFLGNEFFQNSIQNEGRWPGQVRLELFVLPDLFKDRANWKTNWLEARDRPGICRNVEWVVVWTSHPL